MLKAVLKKSLAGKEAVHRFVFREDGFELKSERGEQITAKGTVAYADIMKVVEYSDMWILYLDRSTVLAVARGGMTQGKAEIFPSSSASSSANACKPCSGRAEKSFVPSEALFEGGRGGRDLLPPCADETKIGRERRICLKYTVKRRGADLLVCAPPLLFSPRHISERGGKGGRLCRAAARSSGAAFPIRRVPSARRFLFGGSRRRGVPYSAGFGGAALPIRRVPSAGCSLFGAFDPDAAAEHFRIGIARLAQEALVVGRTVKRAGYTPESSPR